jgi:hypothetical protein
MTDKYFATLPSDEAASEIFKKIDSYFEYIKVSGKGELWSKSFRMYYSSAISRGTMSRFGDDGEFVSLQANHYRNLLLHLKTMTVQNRPAFEARAVNSDYKSLAQTILANGLLDYYLREKKLESIIKVAVENALVLGECFIRSNWEVTAGEIYGKNPETGAPIYEGDIQYDCILPSDVIRDFTKANHNDHQWFIIRTSKNKYDLISKYPELEDKIKGIPSKYGGDKTYCLNKQSTLFEDSDDIYCYEFYHKPTSAVENGRMIVALAPDVVLLDGSLPYKDIPLYRIAPEDVIDSCFGYTVGFDLLQLQEAIDMLYGAVVTNQSANAVQSILVPIGSKISATDLQGMRMIQFDPKVGAPQAMNLTATPPEIFNFIRQLEQLMETIAGVSAVSRGNPEASLKSGAALALVASQSLQFNMGLQQSYAQLLESIGTGTINILREYASVPRIAYISGKNQKSNMKQFTADDLSMVNRVTVESANALSKTTSGRLELANTILQNGLVKNAQEYLTLVQTGQLQPLIESGTSEIMNIRAENESMAEGKPVIAILVDNHQLHIQEHRNILSSPEARNNPDIVNLTLSHIQEHINMLMDANNSSLFSVLGIQGLPQTMPVATPQGNASEVVDATNPVIQEVNRVNMPKLPKPAGT